MKILLVVSLCNKYAKRSEAFSPPQSNFFFKNYKAFFAFCNAILSISNNSGDNSMQWMIKIWI